MCKDKTSGIDMGEFLDAERIAKITGKKKSTAYKIIQQMNELLAAKGLYIVRGRILARHFYKFIGYI